MKYRSEPCDGRAPVVPDEMRPFESQFVEDAYDVRHRVSQRMVLGSRGAVRASKSTQVGSDDTVAMSHEKRYLAAPEVRGVRPPVEQYDGGSAAVVFDMKRDSVHPHATVRSAVDLADRRGLVLNSWGNPNLA